MPNTAWGTPISFSWELEGDDADILVWFAPPEIPQKTWLGLTAQQRETYFRTNIQPRLGTTLAWSQFHRVNGPTWVTLTDEVSPKTWELQCRLDDAPQSLEGLVEQMDQVDNTFPGAGRGFQVHIVFDLPLIHRKTYAKALIGLFTLLNDYATAKRYARDSKLVQESSYGAVTVDLKELRRDLRKGRLLEMVRDDPNAANKTSGYKYNFVGLRTMYTSPTAVGLEIRAGWSQDYGRFKRLLERVVNALVTMTPDSTVALKVHRPSDATEFTLPQHLTFLSGPYVALGGAYDDYLVAEARRLVTNRPELGQPYPDTRVTTHHGLHLTLRKKEFRKGGQEGFLRGSAEMLVGRWRKAFLLWENHPSLMNAQGTRDYIINARQLLGDSLRTYLDQARKGKTDDTWVHAEVSWFFRMTRLYEYL